MGDKELWQHLPFELSPEFLSGQYPIPECDGTKDREYSKVVGLVWSGLNTRNAYLRAMESTSTALKGVADEVHVFAAASDFERMRKETNTFKNYGKLPANARIEHEATADNFIAQLEKLYTEALENPQDKIQVVINFSNHGDIHSSKTNTSSDFSIPAPNSKFSLSEQQLARIGKLLAPLDATIVNGTCFSGDHDDIIFQNMLAHKKELANQYPQVMKSCSCSLTKGGFGTPTYDADQLGLYEQMVFERGAGREMLAASFAALDNQRTGNAELQRRFTDGFKYGQNVPSSRAEKLALYLQAIDQYQKGSINNPLFVDEAAKTFFSPTSTAIELEKQNLPQEVLAQLRSSQELIEKYVRRLNVTGLERFSFDTSAAEGKQFAAQLAKVSSSKTNTTTGLDDLIREADILDREAAGISSRSLKGEENPRTTYGGKILNGPMIQAKLDEAIKAVYGRLDTDLHRRQLATAMINRHLLTVKMLTDPRAQQGDGKMSPLQKIFAWYRACEQMELLPDLNPNFVEGGTEAKAIRESLHKQRAPNSKLTSDAAG